MNIKAQLMDESAMMRSLARITHEIIEKNHGCDNVMLVGIRRRGVPLADILAKNIEKFEGVPVPVGYVDISLYRDDLSELGSFPKISESDLPFDVTGKTIVLVDDVIYTGRTARAAIDCLLKQGRPANIQLAAVIDRGHRELPIRPDFVGKNIPTSREELVSVRVPSIDGECGVKIFSK